MEIKLVLSAIKFTCGVDRLKRYSVFDKLLRIFCGIKHTTLFQIFC